MHSSLNNTIKGFAIAKLIANVRNTVCVFSENSEGPKTDQRLLETMVVARAAIKDINASIVIKLESKVEDEDLRTKGLQFSDYMTPIETTVANLTKQLPSHSPSLQSMLKILLPSYVESLKAAFVNTYIGQQPEKIKRQHLEAANKSIRRHIDYTSPEATIRSAIPALFASLAAEENKIDHTPTFSDEILAANQKTYYMEIENAVKKQFGDSKDFAAQKKVQAAVYALLKQSASDYGISTKLLDEKFKNNQLGK